MFKDVIISDQVKGKPVILLLNKVDIFKEKIKRKGIDFFFKEYKGAQPLDTVAILRLRRC